MATNGTQPWIERVWRAISGTLTDDETQLKTRAYLYDGLGNPIGSLDGAINVHDADVHDEIVNKYLHIHTATASTLAVATSGDGSEYQITLDDATGFTVGKTIHIGGTIEEVTHPVITAVVGNVLTLDRRIDFAHAIGDEVIVAETNMAVGGSLASPVEFWAGPPAGDTWHLTRLLFEMTHGTAGDLGLFGDLPKLTNGVVLRVRRNGQYATLTNWKQNSNMKVDMYDVDFDPRSGGGGSYGTTGRGTFKNAGAILRLDGDTNDRFEVYIQDDISLLDSFTMKVQGHYE